MKNNSRIYAGVTLIIIISLIGNICYSQSSRNELSLTGTWDLALDSLSVGPEDLIFDHSIQLPSTLEVASIGEKRTVPSGMSYQAILQTRTFKNIYYKGKAWYRKTVTIPPWAAGKTALLSLERVLWKSTVYVDGIEIGSENRLSVPHKYDLTNQLDPGVHEIMICVDNSLQLNFYGAGMGGATPWNGIQGNIKIDFYDKLHISMTSIYPDAANKNIKIKVAGNFRNGENEQIHFKLTEKTTGEAIAESTMEVTNSNEYVLKFEKEVIMWDEFNTELYTLESTLLSAGEFVQSFSDTFGFRKIESKGKSLYLNGEPVFLRGTLEIESTLDPEEWKEIFIKAKSYGLNHFRFHSSCPPEAAFEAADEIGFYLQVECPIWSLSFGKDSSVVDYIKEEANLIIEEYGNHPSFCMMSIGNEMEGDFDLMNDIINELSAKDNRFLYTTTSFTFQEDHGMYPEPADDFFVTQWTDAGWVRGQGYFDLEYPDFSMDYLSATTHIPVPIITHEIGQHTVYPNLNDIDKSPSHITPIDLVAIKTEIEKKGLADVMTDYINASGELQVLLYKEEIERVLKTYGISGFQLLSFRGNCGVVNTVRDPKNYTNGDDFRQFCSEVVPLAWFKKSIYSNSEKMEVEVGVANYYKSFLNQKLIVKLSDEVNNVFGQKSLDVPELYKGKTEKYGKLNFNFSHISEPIQLNLSIEVAGTDYKNSWPVWVYPEKVPSIKHDILITTSFDEAEIALNEGKKVLLSPPLERMKGTLGKFITVFYSPTHFSHWKKVSEEGTMGLLMESEHPAFKLFPTESHSNWQWWYLCKNSTTLVYDSLDIEPLTKVIDNQYSNRKLTNLFEVAVGEGKLLFSSINLIPESEEKIEVRQLRSSLIQYMISEQFDPKKALSMQDLKENFKVSHNWQYPTTK